MRDVNAQQQQKPLPPGSLLCTLSSGFKEDTYVFPPDGLCTIVTFNSLITADGGSLDPPYDDDFTYFLETSKAHSTTEYGIGIDYMVARNSTAIDALASANDTRTRLEALWDQRIYHYGQVNTPLRFTGKDVGLFAEDSAAGLMMFSNIMQSKKIEAKRPSYTILHFPVFTEQWTQQIANRLSGYSIDVFVAIGHHAEPDYMYTHCHMVPPTILSESLLKRALLRSEYPVRLEKTLEDLSSRASLWPSITSFAVTLGIEGRWYMPNLTDTIIGAPGNYSLGLPCSKKVPPSGQLGGISKVCSDATLNGTFYFDKKFKALVTYDKAERWLFTYDSASALQAKLCEAKLNALSFKFSLAAVNIEFEDGNNKCGHGAFLRLHRLKKLAPFLANNYTTTAMESACKSLS
ncbi:uncharacterized protein LOC142790003 [Rhipicephalus microplus]|uniref:uncharacterized protein LOC142790003 n=1 Tax=Rhipicephalus microplus TaxID=6941 RepID=UPI003F6D4FE3